MRELRSSAAADGHRHDTAAEKGEDKPVLRSSAAADGDRHDDILVRTLPGWAVAILGRR
ncbi:hypothetical protein [Streptomonospora alba]